LKAGDIYWVNLDPTIGNEIKKKRPVVVLNGGHDKHLKLAIVVPVTAWISYWEKTHFLFIWNPTQKPDLRKNQWLTVFRLGLLVTTGSRKRSGRFQTMRSTK